MSAYALSTSSLIQAPVFALDQASYAAEAMPKTVLTTLRLVKTDVAVTSVWKRYIEDEPQALLAALQRIVSSHSLVRSALKGQSAAQGTSLLFSVQDITQDLYSLLLQKDRFRHYLQSGMTDKEIEREIYQVELTNYLIAALRRCRPENYRIARRIGAVLEGDSRFKLVSEKNQPSRFRQAAEAVYTLAEWQTGMPASDRQAATARLAQIPMRKRDLRCVGCSGDTQVIISNQELAALLSEILSALGEPAPLRVLRRLALSKLPVWDATLTPIETDADDERLGGIRADALLSADANPEESTVHQESVAVAREAAQTLLARLHASTKENQIRTERLWRVLWHCYFDPAEPTQMTIAEIVKVSDSSVGDYRRKLESEMRRLNLPIAQLPHFSDALRQELKARLFTKAADQPATFQAKQAVVEISKGISSALTLHASAKPHSYQWASIG